MSRTMVRCLVLRCRRRRRVRTATIGAANNGPTTRVKLLAADCSETALDRSSRGTEFAAIAMLAGPEKANAIPIPKAMARSMGGEISPAFVNHARTAVRIATER